MSLLLVFIIFILSIAASLMLNISMLAPLFVGFMLFTLLALLNVGIAAVPLAFYLWILPICSLLLRKKRKTN